MRSVVIIENRRKARTSLERAHPGALIVDVTSRAIEPWCRFSPFYPHGDIPIPFSPGSVAASVEGIWQGLKVFRNEDVDVSKFDVRTMKGLKRTTRSLGPVLGHRRGVRGRELLDYATARREIYLPSYLWVLENCLQAELASLSAELVRAPLVLLDYETNGNVDDLRKPLSHASLIARYLDKNWPSSLQLSDGGV